MDFLYCSSGRLDAVEDDEGLAFCLYIFLRNDVDDGAILAEDVGQGLLEILYLDALLEVSDLDLGLVRNSFQEKSSRAGTPT